VEHPFKRQLLRPGEVRRGHRHHPVAHQPLALPAHLRDSSDGTECETLGGLMMMMMMMMMLLMMMTTMMIMMVMV
jgi:hypothetical protein